MIHNNSGLSSKQNIDNKNIWLLFYQIALKSLYKMEEFSSIFPYLGEDMVQQTLANFAQSMHQGLKDLIPWQKQLKSWNRKENNGQKRSFNYGNREKF